MRKKQNSKFLHTFIDNEVYSYTVGFFLCDQPRMVKELMKRCKFSKKEEIEKIFPQLFDPATGGYSFQLDRDEDNASIWFIWINTSHIHYYLFINNMIAHESFHVIKNYLVEKGILLSDETEECYAYNLGWLVGKIHELIGDSK